MLSCCFPVLKINALPAILVFFGVLLVQRFFVLTYVFVLAVFVVLSASFQKMKLEFPRCVFFQANFCEDEPTPCISLALNCNSLCQAILGLREN